MTSGPSDLPAAAFDALQDEIRSYPGATRNRGIHYVSSGRVDTLAWTDRGARARVHGTSTYDAAWRWDGRSWFGVCSCPIAADCKHLYALGAEMLQARPLLAPGGTQPARGPAAQDLEELRRATNSWQRAHALRRLVADARPDLGHVFGEAPISRLLDEPDFELMCWHLARALAVASGGWLPAALEPFREREDLAQRFRSAVEQDLVENLERWAETAPPPATDRSVRFVVAVEPVPGRSRPALTIEVRLTSPRLADDSRNLTQVAQLVSDARRHPGRLPAEQLALLETLLEAVDSISGGLGGGWTHGGTTAIRLEQSDLLRFVAQAEGTSTVVWRDPPLRTTATRHGMAPGTPVRAGAQPVSILPDCEERGGRLVVDLFVRGPGSARTPLKDAIFVPDLEDTRDRRNGIVVLDGALHHVIDRPPDDVLLPFLVLDGLALEARRHGRLVSRLTRAFPALGASLRQLSILKPVAPVVAIDVRDSDWLQVRVFSVPAHLQWVPDQPPAPDAAIEEYAPGLGWIPAAGTPPPRSGAEPFELPDDDALAPALDWLRRTGAHDGTKALPGGAVPFETDREAGWWMSMSSRRMATFAAAWEERPAAVRWYCTPRAKRLLIDRATARAKVRVRPSGLDFFEISAAWEAEGAQLTDADVALLAGASGPYVRISSGWVRKDSEEFLAQQAAALADLGVEVNADVRRVTLWELARARPESLEQIGGFGSDDATRSGIAALRARVATFEGLPRVDVPAGFRGTLRAYQQEGLDFLAHASTLGLGVVLADDMGLGKTIQALAWLLWLRERDPGIGPALVVCPASVVHNWEREARAFAPGLKVSLVTSGADRRRRIEEAEACDLLVTNYSLLRRDIELWKKVPLGAAILDEAQFIKNPDAAVSRAARELGARHRLALTGTPLENRALDLWSILSFAQPGLLGSRREFSDIYDRTDTPPHRRRLLAARLRPVLLRRLKSEVARDLPPRIEERRDCELGPRQRKLYAAELIAARREIDMLAAGPGGVQSNKIEILARLTRLRQICCHPALVPGAPGGEALVSGKFEALGELLEPLMAEGQKVLVFSQFVRCLDLLELDLTRRGIAHHMLTGQTKKRAEVVQAFESDLNPCVFLISLKAGGTGLNLTAASYVVLFDPWWNPAVEAQAIDRTHRIGQTRTVIAYRMLALGTIEEKIWELQARKAALAKEILGEDGFAKALTREDLAYLLAPAEESGLS